MNQHRSFSDFSRAEAFADCEIFSSERPPVSFAFTDENGSSVSSDTLRWIKTVGRPETVTDFPNDGPVSREVTEIVYVQSRTAFTVRLRLTRWPGYPVVEYDAVLENTASESAPRIRDPLAYSGSVYPAAGAYTLHYTSGTNDQYVPHEAVIDKDAQPVTIGARRGQCSEEWLPYVNMEAADGGVMLSVNWQGNWEAAFSAKDGGAHVRCGQLSVDAVLLPGESLRFPGITAVFYRGDWQEGQNLWRDWFISCNLMRYTGRRDYRQNVYLCSDFSGVDADEKAMQRAYDLGFAGRYTCAFTLDAGWYRFRGGEWWMTGDWSPNPSYEKLPELGRFCAQRHIDFCIWHEPERILHHTPTAQLLGDSLLFLKDGHLAGSRDFDGTPEDLSMGLVHYGKKNVQDYAFALIDRAVTEYGMTVYRQDYNICAADYWDAYDAYETQTLGIPRTGMTENKSAPGYLEVWRRLAEKHPGLIFDACAGGGRRYDLETARFAFLHTKSDYWMDVTSAQCQNYATLSWLPFTGTGFMDEASLYDIRSRLTASIGVGCTENADLEKTDRALREWASMQRYFYDDYYTLTPYCGENKGFLAMEFCRPGEGAMVVAYFRQDGQLRLKLRGLKENARYLVRDADGLLPDTETDGASLAQGLVLARPAGSAALIWVSPAE